MNDPFGEAVQPLRYELMYTGGEGPRCVLNQSFPALLLFQRTRQEEKPSSAP